MIFLFCLRKKKNLRSRISFSNDQSNADENGAALVDSNVNVKTVNSTYRIKIPINVIAGNNQWLK